MSTWGVRRSVVTAVGTGALVLAFGYLVVGVLAVLGFSAWVPGMYVAAALSAFLVWKLLRWPTEWDRYLSFGAVFLLACVLNRALYTLDFIIQGPRFADWPVYVSEPEWAVFKGEALTLYGTLLTVFAWQAAGGGTVSLAGLFDRSSLTKRLCWLIYSASVAVFALSLLARERVAALGQLLPTVMSLGLVAALQLTIISSERPMRRLLLILPLTLPFFGSALGLGMKENLFLSLLPVAIIAWSALRNSLLRVSMVAGGILLVSLITAYVGFYRSAVWYTKVDRPTSEVISEFREEIEIKGFLPIVEEGTSGLLGRNNASIHRGLAVAIADQGEFLPDLVFGPLAYVFIPRVLWPDKPAINQGWDYSGLIFGERYKEESGSSTAAGLYTSFYLGGGWFAMFAGASAIGILVALCSRAARRFGGSATAGLFSLSLLPFALRLDETWSVGAISGPVVGLVYVLLIVRAAQWFDSLIVGTRRSRLRG